ncbi:MAG: hypothetical protein Q9174_002781 [Haloplaca sp. 1 TL-2023]
MPSSSRVAIIFAFGIYVKAGIVLYHRREHLDGYLNPFNEHPFTGIVTTDIEITIEQADAPRPGSSSKSNIFDNDFDRTSNGADYENYNVTVEAGSPERRGSKPEILRMRKLTRQAAMQETTDLGAWLYARVAFLFFLSMLIIWIPSSVNRVYSLAHPTIMNYPLNYVSSLVLPMQGFLNAIVYIITSQSACRDLWNFIRGRSTVPWRHLNRNGKRKLAPLASVYTSPKSSRDERSPRFGRSESNLSGPSTLNGPGQAYLPR